MKMTQITMPRPSDGHSHRKRSAVDGSVRPPLSDLLQTNPGEERREKMDRDLRWGIEVLHLGRGNDVFIVLGLPFAAHGCKPCSAKGGRTTQLQTEKDAIEHISVSHSSLPLRVSCDRCGRIFGSPHAFHCHFKHCEGPPPILDFACVRCSKSFASKRGLSQHNRSHYSPGVSKDPVPRVERRSTWTLEEEQYLLDLEERTRDLRDRNFVIAAGLRRKSEAQVRARRALKSHRVKAIVRCGGGWPSGHASAATCYPPAWPVV
jgi:hypothetical protein